MKAKACKIAENSHTYLASIIPGNLIIKLFLFIFYLSGLIYITSSAVYSRVTQTNTYCTTCIHNTLKKYIQCIHMVNNI